MLGAGTGTGAERGRERERGRSGDGNGNGGGGARRRKTGAYHFCKQEVVLAGTRHLRSQGPVSVHAHCTEGVTGSEGREEANGAEGEIRVGGGNGDGNEVGSENGDVDGDRDGTERE